MAFSLSIINKLPNYILALNNIFWSLDQRNLIFLKKLSKLYLYGFIPTIRLKLVQFSKFIVGF
jgi:hypothetical protein